MRDRRNPDRVEFESAIPAELGEAGEGDERVSEKERDASRNPESEDPLEEQTQRMSAQAAPPRSPSSDTSAKQAAVGVDTTTWARDQGPPALLEEQETIVSVPLHPDPQSESIAPSSSLRPMLLERVEPSLGRGERLRLDASHWRVSLGRAEKNDLRLYTESASREHAVIAGNALGEWVLTPTAGKTVGIDGDQTSEPVVLEIGMNIMLGGDQLRCVTEGIDPSQMAAQTSADSLRDETPGWSEWLGGLGPSWWLIGGVALLGLGLIAFAWFGA